MNRSLVLGEIMLGLAKHYRLVTLGVGGEMICVTPTGANHLDTVLTSYR